MNANVALRISGFLLVFGLVVLVVVKGWQTHSGHDYEIKVNGVFVLVDEQNLLTRIHQLASSETDRQVFIDKLNNMLVEEPYIKSSSIRYTWPGEVVIDLKEIVPTALVHDYGFLTSACQVIEHEQREVEHIHVFELESSVFDKYRCQQINEIQPFLDQKVKHVVLLSNGDYRLTIDSIQYVITDEFEVMFDRINRINKQIKQQGLGEALIVDLRYSSGSAVKVIAKV